MITSSAPPPPPPPPPPSPSPPPLTTTPTPPTTPTPTPTPLQLVLNVHAANVDCRPTSGPDHLGMRVLIREPSDAYEVCFGQRADGGAFCCTPLCLLAGVSTVMERERQQNEVRAPHGMDYPPEDGPNRLGCGATRSPRIECPDHLGLRGRRRRVLAHRHCLSAAPSEEIQVSPCRKHGLSSNVMALITSGCGRSGGGGCSYIGRSSGGALTLLAQEVSHGLQLQSRWRILAAAAG